MHSCPVTPRSTQVVMRDRVTDKPRGFGFVTFADEAVADKVCAERHELQGRQVRITSLQGCVYQLQDLD